MLDKVAVAERLAAAGARLENMSVLCGILSRQEMLLRQEFQQLQAAVVSPEPEEEERAAQDDLGPDILE